MRNAFTIFAALPLASLAAVHEQATAQSAQAPAVLAPTLSPIGAPLWGDLTYGMAAEEVAAILRRVEGIKEVKVKQRKNKAAKLGISYVGDGVELGPSTATVETSFGMEGLTEVRLKIDDCHSAAVPKFRTIAEALKTKYGNFVTVPVVDQFGQPVATEFAAFNQATRVRISFWSYNPALQQASAPGSGAAGALADIFGAISSNAAEHACPADAGARSTITFAYVAQAAFLNEQAHFRAKMEETRQRTAKDF